MSNSPTRLVVVDDTDPRIQYQGTWLLNTAGATESWGIYGPTYNRTLHDTTSDGSFEFKFNGTEFHVHATIDTENNRARPSWICNLDGRATGRVTPDPDQHTNHWIVCEDELSGLEEHTLVVNVTVPAGAQFWLDAITYAPTSDVTAGETILIQQEDNSITYSPAANWNFTDGIVQLTDIVDSYSTFKFTGTAVTFFSVLRPNLVSSTGKYSIDGGPETSFTIPGHVDTNRQFNMPLFSANGLAPQEHTLVTTYTGSRNQTPLSLDYFFVTLPPKNNTSALSPSSSASGTAQAPGASSSQPSGEGNSTPVGAIVGGVVGGVVGLALLGLLFFLIRRRRRQSPAEATPFMAAKPETLLFTLPSNQHRPKPYAPASQYNPYSPSSVSDVTEAPSTALAKQQLAMESYKPTVDVQHLDSGLRLNEPIGSSSRPEIRDIPPIYTEN